VVTRDGGEQSQKEKSVGQGETARSNGTEGTAERTSARVKRRQEERKTQALDREVHDALTDKGFWVGKREEKAATIQSGRRGDAADATKKRGGTTKGRG